MKEKWKRRGSIPCSHWKDAGTFPPPNAKELGICVTVNWYPPAFSISLDSEEEREGCSGGSGVACEVWDMWSAVRDEICCKVWDMECCEVWDMRRAVWCHMWDMAK